MQALGLEGRTCKPNYPQLISNGPELVGITHKTLGRRVTGAGSKCGVKYKKKAP